MLYYLSLIILQVCDGTRWEAMASPLRVFRYITFRSAGAALTALLLSWWLGPRVIEWLKELKFGQNYRDKAEEGGGLSARVMDKKGTPTMGGLMVILVVDLAALLWAQWNALLVLTLLAMMVLAGLGFYDDYMKVTKQNNLGAKGNVKLWVQAILGVFIAGYLYWLPETRKMVTEIMIPFMKKPVSQDAMILGGLLVVLTVVGSSNAVNLTDGLDGLAIGCTLIVCVVFLIFTYVAGNARFATYLQVPSVPGAGELTVFTAAMTGACLGFLWYNCHPARVFMGDTGSLALGGALGVIAVLIRQPFVLFIAGGVFVIEALSVMIQTGWFKYTRKRYGTGRRVFLMAPIHHHFEKKGWYESQVVTRFYILCVVFAVIALSTLKIR